jgi:SHS2 domain-containing protein
MSQLAVYKFIDHTADIGIIVQGKTIKELFINAAQAMFDIITGQDSIQSKESIELTIKADDLEDLIVKWLTELLYLHETKEMLFKEFYIYKIDNSFNLKAGAKGEKFDPQRHKIDTVIKAVTYHLLKITQSNQGFEAKILFDV